MQKFVEEAFVSIVAGWFVTILVSEVLLAVFIGFWLRKKLLEIKFKSPNTTLAPIATSVSIISGMVFLAAVVLISHQYHSFAEKLEHDEQEKKKADERSSPNYLENHIRNWLDLAGYSIRREPVQGEEVLRMSATLGGLVFFVSQNKTTPSILKVSHTMTARPSFSATLKGLSKAEREAFETELETELLRMGIPHVMGSGGSSEIVFILEHEFPLDIERNDILYKLFDLKRARRIIQIHTDELLAKKQKNKQ